MLELSDEIKQHCDKELQYHKQYHEEVIKKIREENRNRKKEESPLEEEVSAVEEDFKDFKEKLKDFDLDNGSITIIYR